MSQSNREIRVRHFRHPARLGPHGHRIARRAGRGRKMSLRTERRAARGRSLVLSRRPCHQTRLLVHRRRQGKDRARHAGNVAAAANSASPRTAPIQPSFDRQRARRIAVAAVARRAGNQRFHGAAPAGDRRRRDQPGQRPASNADDAGAQGSVVASRWGELAGSSTQASPEPSTNNSAPANSATAPTPSGRTSAACANGSRGRAPACRRGRIVDRKTDWLGPDAADRHPWRTGACGPAGERDFQAQWPATEQQSRRPARELGFGPDRSSIAVGRGPNGGSMRELGLLPQGSLPRELRAADDADERIAQMLSRLPRRAAT